MKIHSLEFYNKARDWHLNTITFHNLTLLVGASGVGKTQILESIINLKKVTEGNSLTRIKWFINFSISSDDSYIWEGEFDDKSKIVSEKLIKNKNNIINRDNQDIYFNGNKTVKLAQEKSIINLLKEEDEISNIYKGFSKIILNKDIESIKLSIHNSDLDVDLDKYKSLSSIRNSNLSIRTKLYLTSINQKETFEDIKWRYIDIFPFIEDLKLELIDIDIRLIHIKEVGVNQWIDERYISSGMYRALMQISELYLCPEGSVILIDEFENSLGVNCIDDVTNNLLYNDRDLQFIITSHHPYIINNISPQNWKVITRKAGVVSSYDATKLSLGKSKHEAFTQLINLDLYVDGVNT